MCRMTVSITSMAGTSPPFVTKSPTETSRVQPRPDPLVEPLVPPA